MRQNKMGTHWVHRQLISSFAPGEVILRMARQSRYFFKITSSNDTGARNKTKLQLMRATKIRRRKQQWIITKKNYNTNTISRNKIPRKRRHLLSPPLYHISACGLLWLLAYECVLSERNHNEKKKKITPCACACGCVCFLLKLKSKNKANHKSDDRK